MALDTLIKKFFPGVVGLVLALIAYFQAAGVVELATTGALAIDSEEMHRAAARSKVDLPPARATQHRSAQAIIDHNIFDHATDLNPPPEETEPEDTGPPQIDLSDPLTAARCEGVEVNIITESPIPEASLAVVKVTGDERPMVRHIGDVGGGFEIAYIGFNRLEASPAVWMIKDAKLCQALLFEEATVAAAPAAPAAPSAPPAEPAAPPGGKGAPGTVPSEIAEKIEKVSETEFNVDRAVVDNILEHQAELMRTARIVPEKGADGKTVGIRLFGVRPDTLLGTLGLQNGDRLETINGFNMGNPEEALNAYARLRSASKLTIKVTRRGKPTTLDFNIK
jgi:general secretion pathway protein C